MQVRSLQKSNTIMISSNKRTSIKAKTLNEKQILQEKDLNKLQKQLEPFVYQQHPAAGLLRGTNPNTQDFRKFVTLLYRGLFYSAKNLKGPSEQYLKKKKVKLPQPQGSKKKLLVLDLDQTLIHSIFTSEKTDVKFTHKGDEFKFNVRPYCYQFLQAMSAIYNVYVFTAGTQDYAEPIVSYLNQKKKTILGVLHRKNCMQTHNGFFIKDLRIISNRQLKDICIVDNLVHSFGLQLQNGIPILEFLNNKNDRELVGLQKFLIQMSKADDVRQHIKKQLKLREHLQIEKNQFISLDNYKYKS